MPFLTTRGIFVVFYFSWSLMFVDFEVSTLGRQLVVRLESAFKVAVKGNSLNADFSRLWGSRQWPHCVCLGVFMDTIMIFCCNDA